MTTVRLAPAKLNLGLRILERRMDGFHELESVFVSLHSLADVLFLENIPRPECEIECSDPALIGPDNLIYKAWLNFCDMTGMRPGIRCRLIKNIPKGSGLGGGSSDAATMLAWLSRLPGFGVDTRLLSQIGQATGADVPYFFVGGPARVSGIGEKIVPLAAPPVYGHVLLVLPPLQIGTRWAYQELDRIRNVECGTLTKQDASATQNRPLARGWLINDLEEPVFASFPLLASIKERLLRQGADQASMSGSGAAIFGIFSNQDNVASAAQEFVDDGLKVHLAAIQQKYSSPDTGPDA